jgi:hypothetical protein
MKRTECPFADLNLSISSSETNVTAKSCPYHRHAVPSTFHHENEEVPLRVINGTHHGSEGSALLLKDIGGGDRIREFCTRFYAHAFLDQTLEPFFFHGDGATAHGKRLADWIIQKIGGEGEPWSDSGRWGLRQPAHSAAWNNIKRDPEVRGRHFQLDESRIWMRLHFWAVRECGLHQHSGFWKWYISFIEHFIAVYERKAPRYAENDSQWSENPINIEKYLKNHRKMIDVLENPHIYV